jgi:hypothetical protein
MKQLLLCVFCLTAFSAQSQTPPVEIVLDSIKTDKTQKESRTFTVYYHVTNLSYGPISFFLNTDSMVPLIASAVSIVPHYELFQDNKPVRVSRIFETGEASSKFNIAEIIGSEKNEDSIHAIITRHFDRMSTEFNNQLVNSVLRLSQGETQKYSAKLQWNLQRYQKQDDNEYYLEAGSNFQLQLSMRLLLDELKDRLTPEQYQGITADKSFIKGLFMSNKARIDLSE